MALKTLKCRYICPDFVSRISFSAPMICSPPPGPFIRINTVRGSFNSNGGSTVNLHSVKPNFPKLLAWQNHSSAQLIYHFFCTAPDLTMSLKQNRVPIKLKFTRHPHNYISEQIQHPLKKIQVPPPLYTVKTVLALKGMGREH